MMKNTLKMSAIVIMSGLISITFLSGFCFADGPEVWLSGWSKRRPIILHNYSKSDLLDHQVKVGNPLKAKTELDYRDVRFTDSDGITLLKYYLEKDGSFWVKVPRLGAGLNNAIFMYYGNKQADSLSDGKAVFDFFEDFQSQDLSQWQNNGWNISSQGLADEELLKGIKYSAFSQIKNAKLERTLSLPSANMRIEIYAAMNGDLLQNYLIFYEDNKKKIIWDETGGWVKKGIDLGSAKPEIKFLVKTDGEHTAGINVIFAYRLVEPGVTVDLYSESNR